MSTTRRRMFVPVALAACATLAFGLTPAAAASPTALPAGPALAKQLVDKISVNGINRHLIALQRFSDTNAGTRAASTAGHRKSAEYIATKLEAASFQVTRQEFPFTFAQTLAEKLTADGADVPVTAMSYTKNTPIGGVTAPLGVIPADGDATPGCEAADFRDLPFADRRSATAS